MSETTNQKSIEAEAQALERLAVKMIQDKNWGALEKMLDPACQFVNSNGAYDRESAMSLIREMNLGPVEFRDFKVTQTQDSLIVSFWLAATEDQNGVSIPLEYSPRLSVWRKRDSQWQCIAYADLISEKIPK
jgi:hypothetical protein